MYLHFMGKLIHQNQIKQDLSTMHSLKKQREEYQRSLSSLFKGFLLKFSNFRKKSLRIIFMNALCKYFETYKTLQVV